MQRCMGCIGRARDSLPRFSTFERPPRDTETNDARPRETDCNSHEWRPPSGTSYARIETRRKLARVVAALGQCVPPTLQLLPSRSNFSRGNFTNFPPRVIFRRIFRLIRFFLENCRFECFFIGFSN